MLLTGIVTLPALVKGSENEVLINKAALAAHPKISNDPYFSDTSNWRHIVIIYKSNTGNQTQYLVGDATLPSPKGIFNPTLNGRDSWEISEVKITDFDDGYIFFKRHEIDTDNFDINFGIVGAYKLSYTQQPLSVEVNTNITPSITVEVRDGFNRLVTGSSAEVTLAIAFDPSASATLSGTTVKNAVNGVVTFDNIQLDTIVNGLTLIATSANLVSDTSEAINVIDAPTQLVVTSQPSNVEVDNAIAPPVIVDVRNAANQLVAAAVNISATIANDPSAGSAVLSGTTTVRSVNGQAIFSNLVINEAFDNYTIQFNSTGLTPDTTAPFNVLVDNYVTQMVITQQPTDIGLNTAIAPAITVELRNANNELVTTANNEVAVTFNGTGLLSGTLSKLPTGGIVTFDDLQLDTPEAGVTLDFASFGLTTVTSDAFEVIDDSEIWSSYDSSSGLYEGTETTLSKTQGTGYNNISMRNGADIVAGDVVVDCRLEYASYFGLSSQPLPNSGTSFADYYDFGWYVTTSRQLYVRTGATQTYKLASSQWNHSEDLLSIAIKDGNVYWYLNGEEIHSVVAPTFNFPYKLAATMYNTGSSPITDISIEALDATFDELLITENANTQVGVGNILSPITVELGNSNDLLEGQNGTLEVSVAILNDPSGQALLSGVTTKTMTGGVVVFDDLSIDELGSGFTLEFTATGVNSVVTTAFDTIQTLESLNVSTQPQASTVAGQTMTSFEVEVLDGLGNLISGYVDNIQLSMSPSFVINGTTLKAPVNGVVTFDDISLEKAYDNLVFGFEAVTESITTTSNSFNITPDAKAAINYFLQPSNVGQTNTMSPFSVEFVDQFGNRTADTEAISITLASNPGPSTLSGTTSKAAVNGLATFGDISLDTQGSGYTFEASSSGVVNITSLPFDVLVPNVAPAFSFDQSTSDAWMADSFLNQISSSGFRFIDASITKILKQTDGKYFVLGEFNYYENNEQTAVNVMRFNSDGTPDTAWNTNYAALAGWNNGVSGILHTVGTEEKLLMYPIEIGSVFDGNKKLIRINADGTLDSTFATNIAGNLTSSSYSGNEIASGGNAEPVVICPNDNSIVIAFKFLTTAYGNTVKGICKINEDGTYATTWNNNFYASGTTMSTDANLGVAVNSSGGVFVTGDFTTAGGVARNRFVPLLPTGAVDTSFISNMESYGNGSTVNNGIRACVVDSADNVYITGTFSSFSGSSCKVVKMSSTGVVDGTFLTTINSNMNSTSYNMEVLPNDQLLIGQSTTTALKRFNNDGSIDSSFETTLTTNGSAIATDSSGSNLELTALFVNNDGSVFVVGKFASDFGFNNYPIETYASLINSNLTHDTHFGRIAHKRPLPSQPRVIHTSNAGNLFVVGADNWKTLDTINSEDGRILKINQTTYEADLSFEQTLYTDERAFGTIDGIINLKNGKMLAYGNFSNAGQTSAMDGIIVFDDNGTEDATFSSNFSTIGNGSGLSNVRGATQLPDGSIIVSGNFTTVGGITVNKLFKINEDGTFNQTFTNNFLGFGDGSGLVNGGTVEYVTAINSNQVYVYQTLGSSRNNVTFNGEEITEGWKIVRLNSDGTWDRSFRLDLDGNNTGITTSANTLPVIYPDGSIYVGNTGSNFTINGVTYFNLVKILSDGSVDTTFNTNIGHNISNGVHELFQNPYDSSKLMVMGTFASWDGDSKYKYFVYLNSDGTLDSNFVTNWTMSQSAQATNTTVTWKATFLPNGPIIMVNANNTYISPTEVTAGLLKIV